MKISMQRALVSVSEKAGLLEFLKPLVAQGLEVVSTGGTLQYLNQNQIPAVDISAVTGFPEVLDGRVKTLHPNVHMGLLARREVPEHVEQMKHHNVKFFDLVVGNLYPFEKTALDPNSTFEQLIEKIDIGGPSFLRSSAKNYQNVVVVSDPQDYNWVQERILANNLSMADRKKLALKVYSLTSYYDALIVQKLADDSSDFEYLNLPLRKKQSLRYGENAHQKAAWFTNPLFKKNLAQAEIIQGKELSYNNLLDLESSSGLVARFQKPGCVAVKHNNPCGAAIGNSLLQATQKAVNADQKSVFGGIIAFNRTVDVDVVDFLSPIFLECLIAPDYTPEALEKLAAKKNLRVLKWPALMQTPLTLGFKSVAGGMLVQDEDFFPQVSWSTVGQTPQDDLNETIKFGELVCGFLKSNAIALVYQGQTIGLGMGQVNRVDSVKLAVERMNHFRKENAVDLKQVVAVSDAFFPFPDSIDLFKEAGIQWIAQPGGSLKDKEVIAAAQSMNINMILTQTRHFRH